MVKIIYNKIVRDKIPEIIEASGKACEIEILSDEKYLQMLELIKFSDEDELFAAAFLKQRLTERFGDWQSSRGVVIVFDKTAEFVNINYHHNSQHGDSEKIPKAVV